MFDTAPYIDSGLQPAFEAWAGTPLSPVPAAALAGFDWSRPGPVVVHAFHGTTHDFSAFSLKNASHEAQFGKVFYFTSSPADASINYASETGPDLVNRIERRSEILYHEIFNDPEAFDLPEDAETEAMNALATERATKELLGPVREVHELYLRLDSPFVIDASGRTDRAMFPGIDAWSQALEEVAADLDLDPDDLDDKNDEHQDAIFDRLDEIRAELHERISRAILIAAHRLGCNPPRMPEFDDGPDCIGCNRFEHLFKETGDAVFLENEEGEMVSGSFFAMLLEELGYDSIVLLNAEQRFETMRMDHGTTHIHLMGSGRARIKSIRNGGGFDPTNPDIFS